MKKQLHKTWFVCGLLTFALICLCLYFAFGYNRQLLPFTLSCPLKMQDSHQCVSLELADTPQKRTQGLSDRTGMPDERGMLFVPEKPDKLCLWMKDMHFSLDMIWLDGDKKILKIERGISPDTYPQTFCADSPARYVIEVNDGVAERAGLAVGQRLKL